MSFGSGTGHYDSNGGITPDGELFREQGWRAGRAHNTLAGDFSEKGGGTLSGGSGTSTGGAAVVLFFIIFYGGMWYGWIPWSLTGFLGSVVLAVIAVKTARIWGMALVIGAILYSVYTWGPTLLQYSPISVRFGPEAPAKAPPSEPVRRMDSR